MIAQRTQETRDASSSDPRRQTGQARRQVFEQIALVHQRVERPAVAFYQ